ncbi:MAG TPA: hypothetical protein VHB50_13340 [Bryobacteraceae bacterium]|nr:hypothetical protein [Bryobacteraceae bacterium]
MSTINESPRPGHDESRLAAGADKPRKLTAAENAILTIKVLAGFGLLGIALWAIELWLSGK